ncbi:MAG: phosphoribosylamine---glycine ligase, partial [Actinomycetota bacterium]|nr:phosphoribosylamine---glycine ligase [Actinomycetota bacterium]
MKVLLLGSGGRESALAWALDRSPSVDALIAAPGNPGIGAFAELRGVDPTDVAGVLDLAKEIDPQLVVVGPEAPLVAGVGDALRDVGIAVFGPDAAAARIEGSKSYAKELMNAAEIPTAASRSFDRADAAIAYLHEMEPPYVIKADGLAAGKGVVVTPDRDEAVAAIEGCLIGDKFGAAGRSVLIEEFLDGEETSLIAFSDGARVVPCEPAQDYKRVFDDDEGPNTGGMGSYSPVPSCPPSLADEIVGQVLEPMIAECAARGTPFRGALYAGLALTTAGPKVIEFNARFGDPETQALLPRLTSDLGELCLAAAEGDLSGATIKWSGDACVSLVLASGGYPGAHETGFPISGLAQAAAQEGVQVFHAGTKEENGDIVTAGGRVLAVSAVGSDFAVARRRAY